MTCLTTFPPIDPYEVKVLTFNFSNGVPSGGTLGTPVLAVTVTGTDPSPATRFSSPQVSGLSVLITAHDCLDGNTYHLHLTVPTNNPDNALALGADLPCQTF